MSLGQGTFKHDGVETTNDVNFNDELRFSTTAKTDIHFAESRGKKWERMTTLIIACFVAIFSAIFSDYVREKQFFRQKDVSAQPTQKGR
jgi:hypothetical protein